MFSAVFRVSEADSAAANEPKYVKVSNLPDDVTAKSLRSFIEAFGRVGTVFFTWYASFCLAG